MALPALVFGMPLAPQLSDALAPEIKTGLICLNFAFAKA
jgi:hypothetical protein